MAEEKAIIETENAETKAGVQLNIVQDLVTGSIAGNNFEIAPNSNVSVYTDAGFPVDDETPRRKNDLEIIVRKDWTGDVKGVAMYGASVELNAKGVPVISTKGKVLVQSPDKDIAAAAKAVAAESERVVTEAAGSNVSPMKLVVAEARSVGLRIEEGLSRVTLPGGKVFDFAPNSDVISYDDDIQKKKPDGNPPATTLEQGKKDKDTRITIKAGFNGVAMDKASVGLTADGVLAVTTDGIVTRKKPANRPSVRPS